VEILKEVEKKGWCRLVYEDDKRTSLLGVKFIKL
jgi:hypothetical protein